MNETPRKRGRPRGFDESVAVHRATDTFLRFGYSGASLEALTTAMGVNKPSLYAAFGDKRALFQRTVEARAAAVAQRLRAAFEGGDGLEGSLRAMLLEAVAVYLEKDLPPGCLVVSGTITEAVADEAFAAYSRDFFALCDRTLARWIERRAAGSGPISPLAAARMTNGVVHDIALRARVGEARSALQHQARDAALAIARACEG